MVIVLAGIALFGSVNLVSSLLGWRKFASGHCATVPPEGDVYDVPMLRFGGLGRWLVVYRNSAVVVFAEEGMYVFREGPFVLFHPPFLVSWESVRSVNKENTLGVFPHYVIDVQDDAAGTLRLRLRMKVKPELERYYRPMMDVATEPSPVG
jgi:hypothetical protein